jgi:hypothetical protein
MLRHSQNMNGSRMAPQTALSTSASCAKAALAPLTVDVIHARNITSSDATAGKREVLR